MGPTLFKDDSTGDIIVAFRGTATSADVKTDAANALATAVAYKSAITLAQTIVQTAQSWYPNANITFVGHSMGGGEAALASAATGLPAVTFNAAGVVPSRYGIPTFDPSRITNYNVIGEPLTTGQILTPLPNALGSQVYLPPITPPGLGNAFNHSMSSILMILGAPEPEPTPWGGG